MQSILLVDDEYDVRDLMTAKLIREGFEVFTAMDGEKALERLNQRNYDVLITDLQMPVMTGNVLLESITGSHKEMIRIVITGFSDSDNIRRALNAGADHLIEKPVDMTMITMLINRLLSEQDTYQSVSTEQDLDQLTSRLFASRLKALDLNIRQRALVSYILKGVSNKGISQITGQSEQVVKNAISIMYKKLGINSRSQLFHVVFPI